MRPRWGDLPALIALVVVMLGLLAPWVWFAGAVQALWAHLAVMLLGLAAAARSKVGLGCALIAGAMLVGFALPSGFSDREPDLVVLTWNAHGSDRDPAEPLAGLADSGADILVITELTPHWASAFDALPGYRHRLLAPERGAHGVGLYSRWPLSDPEVLEHLPNWPRKTVLATVAHPGGPVRIAGLHTPSPLSAERPARAAAMSEEVVAADIVAGDFNMTPWMSSFRALRGPRRNAGGCQGTWPSRFAPIGLPLDHVLVDSRIGVIDHAVGPSWGSDHHSVTAWLFVGPDP